MTENCLDASRLAQESVGRGHRHERMLELGRGTPIERRMGVENLVAAKQKQNKAERVDPMCHADGCRVPEKPTSPLDDRDIRRGSPQNRRIVFVGQARLRCLSKGDTIRAIGWPAIHSPSTLVESANGSQ